MQNTQAQITKILGITSDAYSNMMYEEGLNYLACYLQDDDEGQRMLAGYKMFWQWWKLKWRQRDAEFIQHLQEVRYHKTLLADMYAALHQGYKVSNTIKPPRCVVAEAFETVK